MLACCVVVCLFAASRSPLPACLHSSAVHRHPDQTAAQAARDREMARLEEAEREARALQREADEERRRRQWQLQTEREERKAKAKAAVVAAKAEQQQRAETLAAERKAAVVAAAAAAELSVAAKPFVPGGAGEGGGVAARDGIEEARRAWLARNERVNRERTGGGGGAGTGEGSPLLPAWWNCECPLTLQAFSTQPHPPFNLQVGGVASGEGSEPVYDHWFDGGYLATYLVQSLNFVHPVTRQVRARCVFVRVRADARTRVCVSVCVCVHGCACVCAHVNGSQHLLLHTHPTTTQTHTHTRSRFNGRRASCSTSTWLSMI